MKLRLVDFESGAGQLGDAATPTIPFGYCRCGCGQQTPLATRTRPEKGLIKGQPIHFLPGHHSRGKYKPMPNAHPGTGFCECGCGQQTPIATRNSHEYGIVKGQPIRFILGHNGIGERNGRFKGEWFSSRPGRWFVRIDGKAILRARAVAEQTIGRTLRPGEVVHHINGIRTDDRPENLLVVASNAQHMTLHTKYSDEELLNAVRVTAEAFGLPPKFADVRKIEGLPDPGTIIDRFGSWRRALKIAGCEF